MDAPTAESPPLSPAGTAGHGRTPGHVFDAFISYSHRADDDLAPSLRDGLHRLAKPWYRTRAVRVFLDEAAMSAEPGLWPSIQRGLDGSGAFVLLLSPGSARSVWVAKEISHWLAAHGTHNLLLVLTAGELVWDPAADDFDHDRSTAVPAVLHGAFEHEPRHVDMRWAEGRTDLTLRNPRFLDDVAELAAPIRRMSKDELVGSDLREHRKAILLGRIAVTALVLLLIAAVFAAVIARNNATRAEARRVDAQAVRLRSESVFGRQPTDLSFLLAARAFRMRATPENRAALVFAAQRSPDLRRYIRAHSTWIVAVAVTDDGTTVVSLDNDGILIASDARTGEQLARATVERRGGTLTVVDDTVLVTGLSVAELRDAKTLAVRQSWSAAPNILVGAAALTGRRVALVRLDGAVAVEAIESGGAADATRPTWTTVQKASTAVAAVGERLVIVGTASTGRNEVVALDAAGAVTSAELRQTWLRSDVDYATTVALWQSQVAVGTTRGQMRMFDAASGADAGDPISVSSTPIRAIAAGPGDSPYLLAATDNGDYHYVEPARRISFATDRLHNGATNAISWSPSGVAASGGADGVVAVLDTVANRIDAGTDLRLPWLALDMAADGARVTGVGRDGAVQQVRIGSGAAPSAPTAIATAASPFTVLDLGDGAAAVADTTGGLVVVRRGGTALRTATPSRSPIVTLREAAGDRIVGLRGNGLVHVWRVAENRLVLERTLSDRASAIDVQGRRGGRDVLFTEVSGTAVVVGADDGVERARFALAQPPSRAAALNAAGTLAAIADGTKIRIWDIATRTARGTPIDAGNQVTAVAFVDADRHLLSADVSSGVRLTDVATGQSLGRLADEDGPEFSSLGVAASSQRLAIALAGLSERTAQLRTFDITAVLRAGCAVVDRGFTDEERKRNDIDGRDPCDDIADADPSTTVVDAPKPTTPESSGGSPQSPGWEQEAMASTIVDEAQRSGIVVGNPACVRSLLQRTPDSSFQELVDALAARQRAASAVAEANFAARFGPIDRWCTTGGAVQADTEGAFDDVSIRLDEVVGRWNAAIGGVDGLTPLTTTWNRISQIQFGQAVGEGVTLASTLDGDRVRSLTVTMRPMPDQARAAAVATVLATLIDGQGRGPGVVAALELEQVLAQGRTSVTPVAGGMWATNVATSGGQRVLQIIVSI